MPPARTTTALAVLALALPLAGASAADAALPAPTTSAAQAGPSAPDATTGSPTGYRAPVDGAVVRLFDPPSVRWGRGHRGVDLATSDGTVRSPGAGVVTFSGRVVDRGVVTVTHPDGLRSSLEPVSGAPAVGTVVDAGDVVGTLDEAGHCEGRACVHWGVRRGDTYLDPLSLLGDAVVVLLPEP